MSKQKVRFVEPMGAPSNVFAKFMNIPLLGPVFLATTAKKEGFDVQIYNENILKRKISPAELLETDILCLSCITATVDRGKEIAFQYKQIRKQHHLHSRVIFGGIHASMLPSDFGPDIDQIVCGEADSIFINILNNNIKNPVIQGKPLEDLDSIPIPDFSLVKNSHAINIWPVMTSRGCPYHCNFCSVTKMFGRNYRTQSIERVLDEIMQYKKGWIFFVDDNFTAHTSRSHSLFDKMISYNFSIPWTAQVRVDTAKDISLVRKMYKAGCRIVFIGFESINPSSLQTMHKSQNLQDIHKAISIFKKEGIQVHGMFMLGNDPDTNEIFNATSDFCRKNKLSYVQYSVLTPLPGTEVFDSFEKSDRLIHKNWSLYDGLHVVFHPKQMSAIELQNGMISCFKSFYSYSNAIKDSFLTSLNVFLKQKHNYPLFRQNYYPVLMKIVGKSILHNWMKNNLAYLSFLKNLK